VSLEVSVADLTASALAVTGIGEEMACALSGVEGRCESACVGWQGLSAGALKAVFQQWSTDDASLLARLGSHADGLQACAEALWRSEQDRAGAFDAR